MTKRASNILSEHEMRRQYERLTGNGALIGKRGLNYSRSYSAWMEDKLRLWWPELSAMMAKELKREMAERKRLKMQTTIWGG
jgi:hypothetical protein